jgi:hypothetical protein
VGSERLWLWEALIYSHNDPLSEGFKLIPYSLTPSAGVRVRINLSKFVNSYQSVNLGGCDRRMPKKFLNHTDIGSSLEQMSGEGVPETMW